MFFEMKYEPFKQQADFTNAAFATLNYIATRSGKHGQEMNRILFGAEFTYTKEEAEQYISSLRMKPWRLWHVLWSPAPTLEENKKKDLDLWALARETMKYLRKHIDPNVEFIVAEHNDHTDIPHVQGLVFFQGRLSVTDLTAMGAIAKQQTIEQRLTLDHALTIQEKIQQAILQERQKQTALRWRIPSTRPLIGMAGGIAKHHEHRAGIRRVRQPKFHCAECNQYHAQLKTRNGNYWCPSYEKRRERELELGRS